MLRVDELDLAFLSVTERVESHGLGLQQLVSEELVVLLPRAHRLARRRQVKMAELGARRSSASARARACVSCWSGRRDRPALSRG